MLNRSPRRAPRRGPVVRALRWLLRQPPERQRMTRRDWQLLAEERGAELAALRDGCRTVEALKKALAIADERAREAERAAATWEVAAQDFRDRLVRAQQDIERLGTAGHESHLAQTHAVALAAAAEHERDAIRQQRDDWQTLLESERAAWREERSGLVRQRHDLANECQVLRLRLEQLRRGAA